MAVAKMSTMRTCHRVGPLLRWLLLCLSLALAPSAQADRAVLRVAIVGGPVLAGVWPALADKVSRATGVRIETVEAAPKARVVPAFASGQADLLLIHGSDETFFLLAQGVAAPLRAWALNEHVIVGPTDDPAGVAQASSGADALRRIAAADAPMIGFRDPGSFAIAQRLWRQAGLRPGPRQQLPDEAERPQLVLASAARRGAYVIVGHIPVQFGRMPDAGLRVLLKGDPAMRRVYVAVVPGPKHPARAAARRMAHRVADYLISPKGQADLQAADQAAHGLWLYPLDQAPTGLDAPE